MKNLTGYVLVKETNVGVPNLVIAAYDAEKGSKVFAERKVTAASIMQLGRRIGSVLSDEDGKFTLTTEDLEFHGNESRPDLLIAVFAPEDVQKIGDPFPLPPEQLLLYLSAGPRTDAGAEEAFVIRLLQAQIDKFQIPVSSVSKQSRPDGTRLASALENSWEFRDSLEKKLRTRLQTERDQSEKRQAAARKQVEDLSGIPRHLRGEEKGSLRNNDLLIRDRNELKKRLPELQKKVVTDGLTRLDERKDMPVVRLHLSKEELAELGLTEEKGEITGTVDSELLAHKVRSLMNGVDLIRKRGINNSSPDQLEKRYLMEGMPSIADNEGNPR